MKFRKLRIAFSAACGIACLLLIALGIRSHWREDTVWKYAYGKGYMVSSRSDGIMLVTVPVKSFSCYYETRIADDSGPPIKGPHYSLLGFGYKDEAFTLAKILFIPSWFSVLLFMCLSAAAWIPWKWRFSLRTLLIATTLIAVVLGLVVYAVRK